MKVTWRRMKWKENFSRITCSCRHYETWEASGNLGRFPCEKGWFRRALRLDAGRCGLPLRPSALHHSSCGLDTPALSGPALRRQRRPRPLGSVAEAATAASLPGSVAAAARRPLALGVDTVAARGSGALGSWHSFGSGSFGLDTAMALAPLVRPFGSPALTPLVRSLGSSPSASCPAPLFRRFRLAVRGIAPCDARCWLPDNWASMSLLAVLLKFARYA